MTRRPPDKELRDARRELRDAVIWLAAMAVGWLLGHLLGFRPSIGLIAAAFIVGIPLEYRRRRDGAK